MYCMAHPSLPSTSKNKEQMYKIAPGRKIWLSFRFDMSNNTVEQRRTCRNLHCTEKNGRMRRGTGFILKDCDCPNHRTQQGLFQTVLINRVVHRVVHRVVIKVVNRWSMLKWKLWKHPLCPVFIVSHLSSLHSSFFSLLPDNVHVA